MSTRKNSGKKQTSRSAAKPRVKARDLGARKDPKGGDFIDAISFRKPK